MGEYIVRAETLSLVHDAKDGQQPHTDHHRDDIIELDDDDAHTGHLLHTGVIQSRKAAERAAQAEEDSRRPDSEDPRAAEKSPGGTEKPEAEKTSGGENGGRSGQGKS